MALARHRVVSIAAIACVVVAFIFHLVGVSAVGWVKFEGEYSEGEMGLWRACNDQFGCSQLPYSPAWLEAVQAFAILGVLVMVACLVCCGLPFCLTNSAFLRCVISPVTALVAAFFQLLEVAIFGGMTGGRLERSTKHSFGYCLPLTVLSCCLSVIAAVLFVVVGRLEPSDNTTSDSNNGQTKRNTVISSRTGKTRPTRYRRAMMTLSVMFRKKF